VRLALPAQQQMQRQNPAMLGDIARVLALRYQTPTTTRENVWPGGRTRGASATLACHPAATSVVGESTRGVYADAQAYLVSADR
jgi:hypothetical protein